MSGYETAEEPEAAFLDDLAPDRIPEEEDGTAPLTREAKELESSVFPGVPFS